MAFRPRGRMARRSGARMVANDHGRAPNTIPPINNAPFAYDALPLEQGPTQAEFTFFMNNDTDYPGPAPEHRRSARLYNRRELQFEDPSTVPHTVCSICSGILWQDALSRCPNCWRNPNPPPAPTPRQPDDYMCYCPCRCSPERDDPLDDTWQSQDDGTGEMETAPPLDPNQPIAHGMMPQDSAPPRVRNYMPETFEHYRAGDAGQVSDPALSPNVNEHNMFDFGESVPLLRYVSRAELSHLLSEGYTRNQLRERFPETTNEDFANYLPPDLSVTSHEAHTRQVENCPVCENPYTARDRRAIRRTREIACLTDAEYQHNEAERFDAGLECHREIRRLRRHMRIQFCGRCLKPLPVRGLHSDWTDGHCGCQCDCWSDREITPLDSTSGEFARISDSTNGSLPPFDD